MFTIGKGMENYNLADFIEVGNSITPTPSTNLSLFVGEIRQLSPFCQGCIWSHLGCYYGDLLLGREALLYTKIPPVILCPNFDQIILIGLILCFIQRNSTTI